MLPFFMVAYAHRPCRGRDVDVIRVPAMGGDALAKEIQYWFDVASDAMVEYKLPRSMA